MALTGGEAYLRLRDKGIDRATAGEVSLRYKRLYPCGPSWCRHGYGLSLTCPHGCHVGKKTRKKKSKTQSIANKELYE